MTGNPLPRWAYRFDNYTRPHGLLREAIDKYRAEGLSQPEQEGTIQRVEVCWELARKLLADELANRGPISSRHAGSIELVGTFGSRATGKARPAPDLDLVVYGPIGDQATDRLRSEFEESPMSIAVDIVAYDRIETARLKQHIDAVMQPLFDPDPLRPSA